MTYSQALTRLDDALDDAVHVEMTQDAPDAVRVMVTYATGAQAIWSVRDDEVRGLSYVYANGRAS